MGTPRFLLLGGTGTVPGRIRNAGPALVAVCDQLDPLLEENGFRTTAPFERIDGIIQFVDRSRDRISIGPIRDSGLQINLEVELAPLQRAPLNVVTNAFRRATLRALLEVAKQYELPSGGIEQLLEDGSGSGGSDS